MKLLKSAVPFIILAAAHLSIVMGQSAGAFTPAGNMTAARIWHTATLLSNGKVLLAGGASEPPLSLRSTELYDPSTGLFDAAGDMTVARSMHTATLLSNGNVLIAGGLFLNSAELYNPATGVFRLTGAMLTARSGHTATLLRNGKVLIAGGTPDNGSAVLASAELYDPATGVFTAAGNMSQARSPHTATLLANGKVLIEGGNSAAVYDSDTGAFSPAPPSGRDGGLLRATLLLNGKVLFTTAFAEDGRGAEIYDPEDGSFIPARPMNAIRDAQTSILLSDGTVLIAGGGDVPDGNLLYSPERTSSAEIYDPATGTFSLTGHMTAGRRLHTATLLADGTVLIASGESWNPLNGPRRIDTAEIYHPRAVVAAPALLYLSGTQGAILHGGTNRIVSRDDPAVTGEALEIYCTGLIDSSVVPPQVAIGGQMAEVLFFGRAPGYTGLSQVNVRVPSGIAPGPAVPVRLNYLGRPTNEVTIGVR